MQDSILRESFFQNYLSKSARNNPNEVVITSPKGKATLQPFE
ncbi:hypothetical protein ESCOMM100M1_24630 [Escherichia coli]